MTPRVRARSGTVHTAVLPRLRRSDVDRFTIFVLKQFLETLQAGPTVKLRVRDPPVGLAGTIDHSSIGIKPRDVLLRDPRYFRHRTHVLDHPRTFCIGKSVFRTGFRTDFRTSFFHSRVLSHVMQDLENRLIQVRLGFQMGTECRDKTFSVSRQNDRGGIDLDAGNALSFRHFRSEPRQNMTLRFTRVHIHVHDRAVRVENVLLSLKIFPDDLLSKLGKFDLHDPSAAPPDRAFELRVQEILFHRHIRTGTDPNVAFSRLNEVFDLLHSFRLQCIDLLVRQPAGKKHDVKSI